MPAALMHKTHNTLWYPPQEKQLEVTVHWNPLQHDDPKEYSRPREYKPYFFHANFEFELDGDNIEHFFGDDFDNTPDSHIIEFVIQQIENETITP